MAMSEMDAAIDADERARRLHAYVAVVVVVLVVVVLVDVLVAAVTPANEQLLLAAAYRRLHSSGADATANAESANGTRQRHETTMTPRTTASLTTAIGKLALRTHWNDAPIEPAATAIEPVDAFVTSGVHARLNLSSAVTTTNEPGTMTQWRVVDALRTIAGRQAAQKAMVSY